MTAARISTIPVEARPYQGAAAGLVTRVLANTVDALVVGVAVAGGYAGYVGIRLILEPRTFHPVEPTWWWVMGAFLAGVVLYLTAGWWISGRTFGGHVMGIRVMPLRRVACRVRSFLRSRAHECRVPVRPALVRGRPRASVRPGPGAADSGRP